MLRARTLLSLPLAAFLFAAGAPALAQTPAADLQSAKAAISRGDYALAASKLEGVKSGPEHAEAAILAADVALTTGRYDDAVKLAKAAAGLGKKQRDDAAAIRAEAFAAQGKTDEAIKACKEVEKDDDARRARLDLGELLIDTGKRSDARPVLLTLVDDYNNDKITANDVEGLTLVGRAEHLLRSWKYANEAYNDAERAGGKNNPQTLLYRADLFLEKYDPGHAGQTTKEALKLAPKDPAAHLMMARVKLENSMDFDGAESELKQALEVNPKLPGAFAVRAGLALRDMDITGADKAADQGLQTNPNDLELLSMKAAIRFLADDRPGFDQWKQKVFKVDPEYTRFFQIVGEFAEWEHRYDDIVKMMTEATKIDPDDAKAWADLGMNLIRDGDDKGGVAALNTSWDHDHFNVRVKNTLDLYDAIARDYTTVEGPIFKIRYNKDEKPVLERYVPRMLNEAWGSMVKRYGFTPKTPVSIEIYPDPEQFSVRTSGLPNVGIQGVCFGQTLAAMSPHAGPFNWGNVLWHELGHVFAIQLSKAHVPRWFTEGLSEYETIIRRPEWHREEDPNLFAALQGKRIPKVAAFNSAFTHVDSIEDVTMAYYAASQIQVFIAEQFGFDKIVAMLPRWANGERTPDVVQHTLGISADELDKRYRAWLDQHLARYTKQFVPDLHAPPLDDARKAVKAEPNNAKKLVELALAFLADGQGPEADATLDEAIRIDPKQPDATFVRLKMAKQKKDKKKVGELVAKLIADGHDGYAVEMQAADLAEDAGDQNKERAAFEAAFKFDPSQAEPVQGLYDMAHKANDKDGELTSLRRLSYLDQHDRRVWNRLLELLLERGLWEDARQVGESAMFVDVFNPVTHRNYARALARTGKFVSAVYELNSALVCKPKPKDQAEIYGELAKAYDALKQPEMAKNARDYEKQVSGG